MTDSLRKLQLVDLELLKKFINFCEQHNITYYALGGTLLGAVRHKGFIPWDDDIDIGIPREDYDRFLELSQENAAQLDFELHTFQNDSQYYRYFARIEDSSFQLIRKDKLEEETTSAWIDIFPLDGMPNNLILRKLHQYYLLYRRAMYRFSVFSRAVNVNKDNRPLIEKLLIKVGLIFPVEKVFKTKSQLKKLDKALKRYPYASSGYLVNFMGAYKFKEMFPKSVYATGKLYEFEDIEINGPEDYDTVCKQLYGDYMTPPDDKEKNKHQSVIDG